MGVEVGFAIKSAIAYVEHASPSTFHWSNWDDKSGSRKMDFL